MLYATNKAILLAQKTTLLLVMLLLTNGNASAEIYRKSTEGQSVVMGKLFTKRGRLEISGPDVGLIMNQAFVNTILLHGGINYYMSESWGLGIDVGYAINSDKPERDCIETFYNNPSGFAHPAECLAQDPTGTPPQQGNIGPAYTAIRETNFLIGGNAIWTPVYGKQLLLLKKVIHFDLFMTFGGGVNMSDYYEKMTTLRNGRVARNATVLPGGSATDAGMGCELGEANCYGVEGRPDPLSSTAFFASASIGQRFNFSDRMFLKLEFKDYLLLGTDAGFENLFTFWSGVGFRL